MRRTLREWRHYRGISMRKLGEMVGISESAVSRHENGSRIPTVGLIKRYASALNIPQSDLIL